MKRSIVWNNTKFADAQGINYGSICFPYMLHLYDLNYLLHLYDLINNYQSDRWTLQINYIHYLFCMTLTKYWEAKDNDFMSRLLVYGFVKLSEVTSGWSNMPVVASKLACISLLNSLSLQFIGHMYLWTNTTNAPSHNACKTCTPLMI